MIRTPAALVALMLAVACAQSQTDGIDPEGKPFDAVAPDEAVTMLGTEPFWSLKVLGKEGLWSTPDNQPGTRFAALRFAGNGGMGISGTLDGKPLTATLTPGECSDGMSERRFPFVATVVFGEETWQGCGYSDSAPFTGPEAP